MKTLSKVLYEKYGIILKKTERQYFNYLVKENNNLNIALKEFCLNSDIRYFGLNKIKSIEKHLLNEEIGRDNKTYDGKGAAGNITNAQMIADKYNIHLEDSVNTTSGKQAIYIKDENNEEDYKEIDDGYFNVFLSNLKTKKINK